MSAWLLAALAVSIPFMGKPTHLACTFQDAEKVPAIDLVIAASHRAVAMTIPSTGHVERQSATLSAAMLSFDSPLRYGTVTYTINRADLSIVRTEGGPSVDTVIAKGMCTIEPARTLSF
jgi:hypothetical protein